MRTGAALAFVGWFLVGAAIYGGVRAHNQEKQKVARAYACGYVDQLYDRVGDAIHKQLIIAAQSEARAAMCSKARKAAQQAGFAPAVARGPQ